MFESPAREVYLRSGGDDDGFALGYCLTAHKSQGSEWPVVIIVLDDSWSGKSVMGREWIYTALSRARALCITVGQLGLVRAAVASPKLTTRKTFLAERILEGVRRGKTQGQA
jgi:exodeoxyribonuclease V alpha subunit